MEIDNLIGEAAPRLRSPLLDEAAHACAPRQAGATASDGFLFKRQPP